MKIVYEVEGHRYLVQYYSNAYNTMNEDEKWRNYQAFETEAEALIEADELAAHYDKVRVIDRGE